MIRQGSTGQRLASLGVDDDLYSVLLFDMTKRPRLLDYSTRFSATKTFLSQTSKPWQPVAGIKLWLSLVGCTDLASPGSFLLQG